VDSSIKMIRTVLGAIAAKNRLFVLIFCAFLAASILAPPAVLSIARKPPDMVTLNPYLSRIPEYITSDAPLDQKLRFLPNLALFWFIASGEFVTEWGFTVTVTDLARILLMSFLFATYFSLWSVARRSQRAGGSRVAGGGGIGGGFLSIFGLSTGPCTVVGCGAPVLPVVGLALVGVSTGTLAILATFAKIATSAVMILMLIAVWYLARVVERFWRPSSEKP